MAAEKGHKETAAVLVSHEANTEAKDEVSQTAIFLIHTALDELIDDVNKNQLIYRLTDLLIHVMLNKIAED